MFDCSIIIITIIIIIIIVIIIIIINFIEVSNVSSALALIGDNFQARIGV